MTAAAPRRVAMLINPRAGRGRAAAAAVTAADRLTRAGVVVEQIIGADAAGSAARARAALDTGPDALVVVGGDGAVHQGLQLLRGRDIPLGIVPAGTGDDHARAYGLPRGDAAAAADVVLGGKVRRVDLGRVRADGGVDTVFGTVLATGFDSLVTDRTNRMRWPRGRMRYNLAVVAELANLRPLDFRLETGDGRVFRRQVVLVAAGITDSYGGGMRITPGADPADGLLQVTVIGHVPRRRLLRVFPQVFTGAHVHHPQVETLRTDRLRISARGITAYADGERIAPLPVEVTAERGALALLVP